MSQVSRNGAMMAPAELEGDQALESAALAGAAAVQRLIAEHANLRNCAASQHRELETMRAINEDLRRRLNLIRHHYIELASKIASHLEQLQGTTQQTTRAVEGTIASDEANLVALAQRLRHGAID